MRWIEPFDVGEIPVSVAATGPTTIAVGARRRGRVDLTVGALVLPGHVDDDARAWHVPSTGRRIRAPGAAPR
ncbi:hypothetical protein [Geodermatophilus sp. CPCC 206100]|uniref:hypothetical protein n=1 Tax=Geodermatophilus sp. CPCC 206100 TaxID=3020054 RepID=UPI003AFFCD9F